MDNARSFQFGAFSVDVAQRTLWREQQVVALPPRVFDLLVTLLASRGQAVSDEVLMQTIFTARHVEKSSLHVAIATLRHRLGDTARPRRFIERVQHGYQFIAAVQAVREVRATKNFPPRAVKYYWKARQVMDDRQARSLRRAQELFQDALALEPEYAAAWAGLADTCLLLGNYNAAFPPEVYAQAEQAAKRAIELDPLCAEAQVAFAGVRLVWNRNLHASLASFQQTRELQPQLATAWHRPGLIAQKLGQFHTALDYLQQARAMEPLSLIINADIAWTYYLARRYDEAISLYKEMENDGDAFPKLFVYYARTHLQLGNVSEAVALSERGCQVTDNPWTIGPLGYAYGQAGRHSQARARLQELRRIAYQQYVAPYFFAEIHLGLGEIEAALDCLEQAEREYNIQVMWAKVEPIFDPVRNHPRFLRLLDRLGLDAVQANETMGA